MVIITSIIGSFTAKYSNRVKKALMRMGKKKPFFHLAVRF
jgi:hypothetical protein